MAFVDTKNNTYAIKISKKDNLSQSIIKTMKKLKIDAVGSIDNTGKMVFYSSANIKYYRYTGIENSFAVLCFSRLIGKSILIVLQMLHSLNNNIDPNFFFIECENNDIYTHLYQKYNSVAEIVQQFENGLDMQFFRTPINYDYKTAKLIYNPERFPDDFVLSSGESFGYFKERIEDRLRHMNKLRSLPPDAIPELWMVPSSQKEINGPCIMCTQDEYEGYAITLPPYFTENNEQNAKILANYISKKFSGICNAYDVKVNGENIKSIFFAYDFPSNGSETCDIDNHQADYSHYITHEIKPEILEKYYYCKNPITVGQALTNVYKTKCASDYSDWEPEEMTAMRERGEDVSELEKLQIQRTDPVLLYTTSEYLVNESKVKLNILKVRKEILESYFKNPEKELPTHIAAIITKNKGKKVITDEEIQEEEKRLEEYKKLPPGPLSFDYHQDYGFLFMYKVPLGLQMNACEIVKRKDLYIGEKNST